MARPVPSLALLALLLAGLTGCIERRITITSEPLGALVHLNDEEIGRTPVTVPFTFYGTYDVRLEKTGYVALWTETEAKSPWWDLPGPDLVAEMGNPEVHYRWHYHLEPRPSENEEAGLEERAADLRARLERRAVEDVGVTAPVADEAGADEEAESTGGE